MASQSIDNETTHSSSAMTGHQSEGYVRRGGLLEELWAWKTVVLLFLTPIVLLPFPILVGSSEARCAYVLALMAIYWITEALPVGVTALLPVCLFPVLEVLPSKVVAQQYMNDVNMLFLGGLAVAIAIEYWNLHKRFALLVLMLVGSEPRWLMLGMMAATWFLSMWISNTATTAMMVPIAEAILQQLKVTADANKKTSKERNEGFNMNKIQDQDGETKNNGDVNYTNSLEVTVDHKGDGDPGVANGGVPGNDQGNAEEEEEEQEDASFTRLCKGMSLSICYAANSGGIASLTGTGPNLALKAHADTIYSERDLRNPVTFGTWMAFGTPLSITVLIVCWLWLQIAFLRCRGACSCCPGKSQNQEQSIRIREVIREEYRKLGPVVFGQVVVIISFVTLVILWITRDLGGVTGWGTVFEPPVRDGAPAILMCILLFALPSTLPCLKSYQNPSHPIHWERERRAEGHHTVARTLRREILPILNWKVVHERMPWNLFLLLGGGFALSEGCKESGLSGWIGDQLEFFSSWNQWAILIIICYITAAATEVTSNTAIATLLMPIMSQLAINTGVHPLYYMFPTALACSFAFMLPVATPPNAIVFAYGRVRIIDMARAGLVMNILAVPILVGATGTLGNAIFDFDNIPAEFLNKTAVATI